MKSVSLLRPSSHYAADSFACGLRALGYTLTQSVGDLGAGDVLLTWNRHAGANDYANQATSQGATVVVAENGYFGRDWRGDTWFALALDHHNGAGRWPRDDGERWRAIGLELEPWRDFDYIGAPEECLVLPQRGIGEPGVAMPAGWVDRVVEGRFGLRVRPHPGRNAEDTLRADLASASCVETWGSGAAIKAIAWGYPCIYWFKQWIGGPAAHWHDDDCELGGVDRTPMFESLACAMWRQSEIESGHAFEELLKCA